MAYAKQVKQWAVIRQVVDLGHSAKAAVASGLVPDEIIAQAQQSIADLRDLQGSEKAGYKRMAEVLPKVFDGMQEVLDDRAPPKLSTGLADLDKLIGFLRPKSMVVIAGRPGSGKTMLGLQIVNHIAIRGAGVGLIFSLEMDEKELTVRTIASQGGIDLRRMEEVKSLDEDEWQRIGTAGNFEGYAAVFNNVDLGDDVIVPGAFTRVKATRNGKLKLALYHDLTRLVGAADYSQDDHGLLVKGQVNLNVSYARDAYELMKAEVLDSMSIGFNTIKADFEERAGRRVRVIKEAELWEASFVPFGMNPEAHVLSVKSDIRLFEKALRERMGLSQKEAAAVASLGYTALRRDGGSEATAIVDELKEIPNLFTQYFGVSP
ncbi:HK97 family phage prohead protease [Pseudomonas sp. NBRC 111131]|uniref:HK97 family phage prohead protease n=1 Tax=Pseudomonas sp. NBRC 111131 TaxID=1661046 RepID=UPI003526EB44